LAAARKRVFTLEVVRPSLSEPSLPGHRCGARGGFLQRTFVGTLLFAVLAVLATAVLSWVSYRGVRAALETEFAGRLESLASTIASQVSPDDVAEVESLGEEAHGYVALQVVLEELRATSRLANASILDTARTVLYDCARPEAQRATSRLDSIAAPAIARALHGLPSVSEIYPESGGERRAGFAPVMTPRGRVAGLVAVEAHVDYEPVLAGLRRDFLLRTLIAALAMAVLAALFLRVAWSSQRLERRLSRAENLAAMGRLTATLAHEIKNPLAIIRGSAERLGKLEPEARRMADYVVEESDRLSRTVARYLQFARGEHVAEGTGDAIAALGDTLALLEGEMAARRVTLSREIGPGRAEVGLDNESLKQVYLNLVLNALEAMSEGGVLAVAVAERGGHIEVRIGDTGPGMTPEVVARLGNPFFTTRAQGSGLGLFLSRRLVESGGGSLRIESAPGKGTVCTVLLPRRRGSDPVEERRD
jgi:signal transduction histidine kinase